MFNFTSTGVKAISDLNDDQVTITRPNGLDYTYRVAAPETFVAQLNKVITEQQSVGRFINKAISDKELQLLSL